MENAISFIAEVLAKAITAMLTSLVHNWPPLALAMLTAAVMKVHVNAEKLRAALLKRPKVSILTGIAVGAFTPLCACGTMAVVLGLLTTALPWGPIMAFLTSSPLMSPDGFIMLAGIIGPQFAIAMAIASILIGLVSGYGTHFIEKKTAFLKDQNRFTGKAAVSTCGCAQSAAASACECAPAPAAVACGCAPVPAGAQSTYCCCMPLADCGKFVEPHVFEVERLLKKLRLGEVLQALWQVGVKQILFFFAVFVMVGFLINYFVPSSFILALFSSETVFAVPLAALIGLPLYIGGESASRWSSH